MPFVKSDPRALPQFFEWEAAGLDWLREADGGARCVGVERVSPGRIELEEIRSARPSAESARAFGAALARTHDAGAAAFGAPPPGWTGPAYIGRREMPCRPDDSWGRFYAEQRVRPFLGPAVEAGNLTAAESRLVEQALGRVAAGAFDDGAGPARIHGDLWTGNVLWTADGAVLIDPAAHGGHRETDLAMLALFGAPHLDAVLQGYRDQHPLGAGYEERVPLHQLHPLAVHAAGHGPSYGRALADAAEQVIALAG
ncbi:fructosamine kinase [Rathayibacter sp. AY1D2]|uniref:fructosamine kinase family protein n=1 Tax=unclassified Rathayibacter TaxID=2609250 RepID=UPI000CE872B4|nr:MULTISPECIES: fructosamine kinase family protein [unclassified Rathayibacter]PPF55028.1 fructosamine kinase [Rathayibacter sp. AY1C2]PPG59100.1 fructosamine kinase [Rathayibacter sp. AY1C7]PPH55430.1 fructosamine kinase [Rathayibacter sp. AY1E1]PPI17531.1 fructosamine kinase [Rathayibacter sp. AY1D2]